MLSGEPVKGIYRHFKGNYYRVLCVATHSETGERLVVYQALYDLEKFYVRPVEMFMDDVDCDKYPNTNQRERFKLVQAEE